MALTPEELQELVLAPKSVTTSAGTVTMPDIDKVLAALAETSEEAVANPMSLMGRAKINNGSAF